MDKVSVLPADEAYIPELISRLRPLDRQETLAASGPDIEATLKLSLRLSYAPGVALDAEGGLFAMFGAMPATLMGDEAVPWMMGTTETPEHPGALRRGALRYLGAVRRQYPRLFNYVDARNEPSIRWLALMGFTIDEPGPFGVEGLPFHRFHMGY